MTATMAEDMGPRYVAWWVEHMIANTRCEWKDIRVAVSGAHRDGTDESYIPSADITLDHVGAMTPEMTQKATARIREFDDFYAADGRPLPTGRHCTVCGQTATMAANLGPACDDHYDELS